MVLLGLLLWKMSNAPSHPSPSFNSSELQSQMESKNIRSAHLTVYQSRTRIGAEKRDSSARFQTYVSNDQVPEIVRDLEENSVDVWIQGGQEPEKNWVSLLIDGVPFLLLLVVFIIMMRRMRTSSTSLSAPGRPL
jgi:ATP-dependent Zn protease